MKSGSRPNLIAGLLIGVLIAAYAALSHYISIRPDGASWALFIAVAPVLAMAFDLARRFCGAFSLALASVLAVAATVLAWPYLLANVSWVYFLQHVGFNLALGLLFARTLLPGRQPLCTFFASFIHSPMSAAVVHYTRQVTIAWSIFFCFEVATSLLLFFLAPLEIWSVFANLLTWPLVGLMFVADHLVRHWALPPEDQLDLTSPLRAYRLARKAKPPPRPTAPLQP